MDYNALSSFRLWDLLDDALARERFTGERRTSLYPSEASVIYTTPSGYKYVVGGCLRKSWYRLLKFPESNPRSIKAKYILEAGKYLENLIVELVKLAGIYENNSVKFWEKSLSVSGEIDIVVQLPTDKQKYIFVECKSSYGGRLKFGYETGKARDLFDHFEGRASNKRLIKGRPKMEHVLQLVIYLYIHRDDQNLLGGKLLYILRDNMNRTEFDITLVEDSATGKHFVAINNEIERGFYVEDIFERYRLLAEYVNESVQLLRKGLVTRKELQPPPRDFKLTYSDEEAKLLNQIGMLSNTAYKKHIKGDRQGDWQCSYCVYRSLCYNESISHTPATDLEEEEGEDDET